MVDVGEAGLAGGVEIRALALEGPQEVVVETVAFRVVGRRRCLLDARVELFVLIHAVIVRGEAGVDIGGNLLHLIGDVGAGEVAEDGHDAVQVLAGALQCFDGVFPRGGGGIISNGGDFGAMALECLVEGGAEVLYLDVCEGRKLVGQWRRVE